MAAHRFDIVDGAVPVAACNGYELCDHSHGAIDSFIGVVRDEHFGKPVTRIEYECHREMALQQLALFIADIEAKEETPFRAQIIHGTGTMVPGDVAVVIHVATAHRDAAFSICRQLIERLKADLPVWKDEHYGDGSRAWLKGS